LIYIIVVAVLSTQLGRIGDIYGRSRMFNLGFVIFTIASFLCGKCGMSRDKDINASINILDRATEGHSGSQACGDDVRPSAREVVAKEAGTTRVAS
jgi:putative transposase